MAAPPAGMAPPPTVITAQVGETDVVPAAEYVGHVEALQQVELRARVEGFLEKVAFREGDMVKAGDLLYVIEQAPFKARLQAARAQVAQAEAEKTRADSRLKRLRTAGHASVSATDLDTAEAAAKIAAAKLAAAEANRKLARIDLSYSEIRAPITGRIGRSNFTRGNLVGPSSGVLATIVQTDPVRVVYSVSETDLGALLKARARRDAGDRILAPRLRTADGEPYPRPGRVAFLDNRVDPATGTIAVRAEFDNPDGLLLPGQYVTVLVKREAPRVMPVVPQAAVVMSKEGNTVFMVDDRGVVVPRPITLGPQVGSKWAVRKGLARGEVIIVAGIQKVRPGMKVTAVPASAAGGGTR